MLVGPAGIGKTTLVGRCLRPGDHVVVRCLSAFRSMEYRPLAHAFGQPFVGPTDEVATDVVAALGERTLVVEDVHWADQGTLAVVSALVGRVPMLVSSRSARPLGASDVTELAVPPLDRGQAAELVRRRHPGLDDAERERIVAVSGGNPFLLENLAHEGTVSPTLRAAVGHLVAELPDPVVDELGRLALRGAPAPSGAFARLGSHDGGMITTTADGTIWFAHDLFRTAIEDALSPGRLRELRRDLVPELPPAEAAHHLFLLGEREAAARCARAAAADADPTARADLLALAADAWGAESSPRLILDAAAAAIDAHRPADARRLAAGLLADGADPEIRAEAGLHLARAAWLDGDPVGAAGAIADALLSVAGSGTEIEAQLVVEQAFVAVRHRVGDPSIVPLADAAVELATTAGVARARALNTAGLARSHTGAPGWDARFAAAYEAATAEGDPEEQLGAKYWLVSALGFYGPMPEAVAIGAEMVATTADLRARRWHHHFLGAHIVHLSARGEIPDAVVDKAVQLLRESPRFRNRAQVELALASALLDRGELDRCDDLIAAGTLAARGDEDIALLACARCELALARRDVAAMRAALDTIVESRAAFFGLNAVAESAAIHLAYGAPGQLAPPATVTTLTPVLDAVALERQAHEHQLAGELDAAVRTCGLAASVWEGRGLFRFARRARLGRAEIAAASGDLVRARRLLDETEADLLDVTTRRRAQLSGEIEVRRARQTLTAREREVLDQVADGLTSQEIATRLGISASTVNSHIDAAMRRLGARTRVQAASLVQSAPTERSRA